MCTSSNSCGRSPCCQFPNVNTLSTPYAWPWVNLASTSVPWLKPVIINSIGYPKKSITWGIIVHESIEIKIKTLILMSFKSQKNKKES
jgi:cellobiose-specific phosphotransferase system component IIC